MKGTLTTTFPSPLVGEGQGGGTFIIRARKLRKNLTDVEQKIWYWLRRKNIHNARFRRQAPIGKYIADFACYDPKLIVELDGGQHATQHSYDKKRDEWLQGEGFYIVRFWNNEVMENMEGVLGVIMERVSLLKDSPLPNPPPQRGEGIVL